jgi:hypothetical protein
MAEPALVNPHCLATVELHGSLLAPPAVRDRRLHRPRNRTSRFCKSQIKNYGVVLFIRSGKK